jgi:hypothetical protein
MGGDKFFTVSDTAAGAVLSGAANQTPIIEFLSCLQLY